MCQILCSQNDAACNYNPIASAGINMAVWSTHPQWKCYSLCLALHNLQFPTGDSPHITHQSCKCVTTQAHSWGSIYLVSRGDYPQTLLLSPQIFQLPPNWMFYSNAQPLATQLNFYLLYKIEKKLHVYRPDWYVHVWKLKPWHDCNLCLHCTVCTSLTVILLQYIQWRMHKFFYKPLQNVSTIFLLGCWHILFPRCL